ncbi:MAG: hypothetical protein RIG67_26705, partial [Rhodospirillales bacterium]
PTPTAWTGRPNISAKATTPPPVPAPSRSAIPRPDTSPASLNAHAQVEAFKDAVEVTGLVMTKLDGSAKGGVVVALAEKFGLPVHAVGVGEGIDDLKPFEARSFARSLMGLDG